MGNAFNQEKNELLILCPNCLKYIPAFNITSPFFFYWCKCFREDKTKNIYEICQWKKITYTNYINAIKNINFSSINLESLSEITNCEQHPNNKNVFVAMYSKDIKCELCKNPGEQQIPIEEYFNSLMEDINKLLSPETIKTLENENYLLCIIYKILKKEISKNKIINNNIINSFQSLVDFIKINENNLKEISEKIEKYIDLNENQDYVNLLKEKTSKLSPQFTVDKKPKLIKIEQTFSDIQTYNAIIGNSIVNQILLFNEEETDINNKIKNSYTIIASFVIGNTSRGPPTSTIYSFSLFPFKKKLQYKNKSLSFRFFDSNLSLSKYGKDTFICAGSNTDFSFYDTILIYSINQENPIITVPINDKEKYILIKSLYNINNDISFLLVSQDKGDQNYPGGAESGHRYITFYNQKGNLIFKEIINNIYHGAKHLADKTICLYIKNINVIVILVSLTSYSDKNKSFLLFYDMNERKYNLLNNDSLTIITNESILEPFIISIWTDNDYLYSLNSEAIIQKWDCKSSTCIQKININNNIKNNLSNIRLLKICADMNRLVMLQNGGLSYYIREKEEFIEDMTIKIANDDKPLFTSCIIEDKNNNDYLLGIKNKNFYIIEN